MKNVSISLSLILMLATGQNALAELSEIPSHPESNIEKIIVVATPEVANFEIYSEKHSERAIGQMMSFMVASLDSDDAKNAVNTSEI